MNRIALAITLASSVALAFAVGCGSSSGTPGGTGGSAGSGGSGGSGGSSGGAVNCTTAAVDGISECYSYTGLPSSLTGTICGANKEASSCPSANQTGCCEDITVGAGSTGYSYGYCTYGEPSSATMALESACTDLKGKWTAK
jgi:hypothetical protein